MELLSNLAKNGVVVLKSCSDSDSRLIYPKTGQKFHFGKKLHVVQFFAKKIDVVQFSCRPDIRPLYRQKKLFYKRMILWAFNP